MDRYHYLGYRVMVGEHLMYAAFLYDELVALLGWASAALRVPARDRYIGWDEGTKHRRLHRVANNVRFLIPPRVAAYNLASKVLGATLRRLSTDWQDSYGHPLDLAETFVDPRRFPGDVLPRSQLAARGPDGGPGQARRPFRIPRDPQGRDSGNGC
jgi:hypothetical protein